MSGSLNDIGQRVLATHRLDLPVVVAIVLLTVGLVVVAVLTWLVSRD